MSLALVGGCVILYQSLGTLPKSYTIVETARTRCLGYGIVHIGLISRVFIAVHIEMRVIPCNHVIC